MVNAYDLNTVRFHDCDLRVYSSLELWALWFCKTLLSAFGFAILFVGVGLLAALMADRQGIKLTFDHVRPAMFLWGVLALLVGWRWAVSDTKSMAMEKAAREERDLPLRQDLVVVEEKHWESFLSRLKPH
jgi:uncharacterized membrane protein